MLSFLCECVDLFLVDNDILCLLLLYCTINYKWWSGVGDGNAD